MSICVITENLRGNSRFQKLHTDYWLLIKNYLSSQDKTESYYDTVIKSLSLFYKKYPFRYTLNLIKVLQGELERNPSFFQNENLGQDSAFFTLHKEYWSIVCKYISGQRTEQYFSDMKIACDGLCKKYPGYYTRELILAFLQEISARTYAEERVMKMFG